MSPLAAPSAPYPSAAPAQAHPKLRELAEEFEASFLAEMLKAAGVGAPRAALGGGAGEDQFSGFLVQEYADAVVRAGGLGLSESIYQALVRTREQDQ